MTDSAPADAQPSFEEALKRLEAIVQRLESGDVPLDTAITLYGEGESLRSYCQARLDSAQARIEKIVTGGDGTAQSAVPFDAQG